MRKQNGKKFKIESRAIFGIRFLSANRCSSLPLEGFQFRRQIARKSSRGSIEKDFWFIKCVRFAALKKCLATKTLAIRIDKHFVKQSICNKTATFD